MTTALSVQLYSLGAAPAKDPAGVIARLASMGYEEVEPVVNTGASEVIRDWAKSMGADDLPPSVDIPALKRALDAHGIPAPSSHAHLPEGEAAQAILDDLELLGSTMLVVPFLFDPEAMAMEPFDDLDRIKQIAERFNVASDLARSRGMRVGYHNHFWEFGTDFDGRSGFEVFFELVEPEVFAEIDVFWAMTGGRDPVELVKALGDRVLLLHVKDGEAEPAAPSSPLGEGNVDVPGVLAAATSARAHIVELEGFDEKEIWPALEKNQRYLTGFR